MKINKIIFLLLINVLLWNFIISPNVKREKQISSDKAMDIKYE
jgi:hypothetical protein